MDENVAKHQDTMVQAIIDLIDIGDAHDFVIHIEAFGLDVLPARLIANSLYEQTTRQDLKDKLLPYLPEEKQDES